MNRLIAFLTGAFCFVAINAATLPAVTAPDMTITPSDVGKVIELPITLTMPEGGDFVNMQIAVRFPDGLIPIAVDNNYGVPGGDIPSGYMSFADNFAGYEGQDFWPDYTIITANFNKKPVTKNPCHIYTMYVTPRAGYAVGSRSMEIYLKYVSQDDASYEIGSSPSQDVYNYVDLCTFNFTGSSSQPGPYDLNGDGKVDVTDVNICVNVILGRSSVYASVADVNGDGRVNVVDLNKIINEILGWNYAPGPDNAVTYTVNGVSFKMVPVEGGTFTMGATSEQGNDAYDSEKPAHQVTLSSYRIGATEVTQALWQAVMGSNPSWFNSTGNSAYGSSHSADYGTNLQRPVEYVSWNDCQEFITKLNQLTGKTFRLPTEAEWEYAARGGNKSNGYKYSGSNTIGDVAWYWDNIPSQSWDTSGYGTQTVGTKQANELGLYDMSGNVWEWCQDWYGRYSSDAQNNPTGLASGSSRVYRGGDWSRSAWYCRVSYRSCNTPANRLYNIGLRLALAEEETYTVNGVSFKMVPVEGGTFTMGATEEQGSDAYDNEKPAHQVTLSSYRIGATEVTQALWQAVMGSNPSYSNGGSYGTNLQRPVEQVSWNDCQEFITKLNQLTGKTFRLPTEAEWEYAARGGNKSNGYKYAGSNTIGDVAWYTSNSGSTTQTVGTKQANELGLYDMSGNVWEWCQDGYDSYSSGAQTNPTGPTSGSDRVYRGGGWYRNARSCRVSFRSAYTPTYRDDDIGFRLAL